MKNQNTLRIYIFYIRLKEGEFNISQVYCDNYFDALDSIILITGEDEDNIEFDEYSPTCNPHKWNKG